ncbi:MAG TPA: ABC transporter permease [Gammaproteobacteria bacterium]|nr:ABC transporter permease [Gammaproteobacteria bacterium]
MHELWQASQHAMVLLFTGNRDLWEIIGISFSVSLKAIVIATPAAFAAAFVLVYTRFRGRGVVMSIMNTSLSLPAVVVGLTLYLLLSRSGPFGDLRLLFTQTAMTIGQVILAFPLVFVMSHSAIQSGQRAAWETALTLGASPIRAVLTVLYEVRFGLIAAVIAGFGRIVAEVGSSMMVGGNIAHFTRNIPTAIALETSKGEFAQGIALGFVLLVLAFGLNIGLSLMQRKGGVAP